MQYKFFVVPVDASEQVEEDLNKFLRSHRVLKTELHFVSEKGYWVMSVEYLDQNPIAEAPPQHRKEKTDFTVGMSEEEKERYELFKTIRRRLATEKSVPAYLIFTNEELAILARIPVLDAQSAKNVKGIAPSRLNDNVIHFYSSNNAEKSGPADGADMQYR